MQENLVTVVGQMTKEVTIRILNENKYSKMQKLQANAITDGNVLGMTTPTTTKSRTSQCKLKISGTYLL